MWLSNKPARLAHIDPLRELNTLRSGQHLHRKKISAAQLTKAYIMNRIALILASTVFSLTALPLGAQTTDHSAHHPEPAKVAQAASPMADGEVRKVDMETKKITIRHGTIENLGMPPMTMVFQVKDPALLDQVKAGDKIRFNAEKSGGAFTVTRIESAQ
jgi:Cu(I)/Ag(I) efflux system periplasmic protein CusF